MKRRHLLSVAGASALPLSGCIRGTFSGPSAGDVVVKNEDNRGHHVVIEAGDERVNMTVKSGSRQTVTLFNSPEEYRINATVDGERHANDTIEYQGRKESLSGPVVNLEIEADSVYFSFSWD
jgi:hypothetical protein